jgi:signal transduction histidine kinase/ActR/RegA family two-component response regulator
VLEGCFTGLAVLVASLIAVTGLWQASISEYQRGLRENLVRLAESAAAVIDPELHQSLVSPEQMDSGAYLEAVAPLRAMMDRMEGVAFMYTYVADGQKVRFVLDAAYPGDHDGDGIEDRSMLWEVYEDADPVMEATLGMGSTVARSGATDSPYTDRWGTFVSGFAPIRDGDGRTIGGVGVDMSAVDYLESVALVRRAAMLGLLPAFGAAVCVGLMVWDQRRGVLATHTKLREQARMLEAQTRELEAARQTAESSNVAKGSFLANMTHELRTPLTAILGYTELLERDAGLTGEPGGWIRALRRSGEHLLSLINDVLDYSKVEAGKMRVERIAFNPEEALDDVRMLMAERASSSRLHFAVEWVGARPSKITGDPTRLRQIVINLVSNAIKFTSSGSVLVLASIEGDGSGGHALRIEVKDTGIGMSPQEMDRLFRPFTQADASMSRRFGGTGLGLSISRELARLMNGDLTVRSEKGRGSVFLLVIEAGEVEWPTEQTAPQETTRPRANDAGSLDGVLSGQRILLAEDGVDNQRLACHHLRRAGAEVLVANNGREAVEIATQERGTLTLILMDMQMPEMDGYEATRALRARGMTLPILALTAHATPEDSNLCMASGCNAFVSKPFTRVSLIEACRSWAEAGDTSDPESRAA